MRSRSRAIVPFAVAALAVACAHSRSARDDAQLVSQTSTTGSGFWMADPGQETRGSAVPIEPTPPELSSPAHPANRLATEACERKLDCAEIGAGKQFADQQVCLSEARRHAARHLSQTSCDAGIDDARFADCMTAVRFAQCGSGFAAIDRLPACAAARLCAR